MFFKAVKTVAEYRTHTKGNMQKKIHKENRNCLDTDKSSGDPEFSISALPLGNPNLNLN